MLRFLGVRHLAVIEHLEVEFAPGLNLLTGETGAGKSILIQAIALLTGGRASGDLVRTGEDLATVQAVFDMPDQDGRDVIVRREIASHGRNRAFVDDQLLTTTALREWGSRLVDLHGQHEHHRLLDPAAHLAVLDAYGRHDDATTRVATHFAEWQAATARLERTRLGAREKQARTEMARFQLGEIAAADPAAGEDDQLEAERAVLANADRLRRLSADAYAALYEGDEAVLAGLAQVWKRVGELATLDPRFEPYLDQRAGLKSALEDLAYFLRGYLADLDASPDRLQAVEDRLVVLERIKRKYGPTLAEVLGRWQALQVELEELEAGEDHTAHLEARERAARREFEAAAQVLSTLRSQAGARLVAALEHELAALAMPACRVEVRVSATDDPSRWRPSGIDEVEFYLSPNPGEELRPLARIASGGELSRIMLALHTLGVAGDNGRTLVFDEVDAGIGGAAADAVGARLQTLAERCQVICITHLPQIAARGGAHFRIAKDVRGGRTTSRVERLDASGREHEIARMIAGADITAQAVVSARELLGARGESERISKAKGEGGSGAKAKGRKRGA